MLDTLWVDGIDLRSLPGIIVNKTEYFADGEKRGSNETIPGRRGQIGVAKPADAYSFSVSITVLPVALDGTRSATAEGRRGQLVANLRALGQRLGGFNSGGQIMLQRRLTTGAGTYQITQAYGEYVKGTALNLINFHTGKTELEFINLDACWYNPTGQTVTVPSGAATVSISGDMLTRKMSIVLPSGGTLYNATTNTSLAVTVGCTVDVTNYTTTAGLRQLTAVGDVSWFALEAGDNVISWSGSGTPSITYHAAYL
jgi:hypothetical protein